MSNSPLALNVNNNFKSATELTVSDIQNSIIKVVDNKGLTNYKSTKIQSKPQLPSIDELINENSLVKPQKTRRSRKTNLRRFLSRLDTNKPNSINRWYRLK